MYSVFNLFISCHLEQSDIQVTPHRDIWTNLGQWRRALEGLPAAEASYPWAWQPGICLACQHFELVFTYMETIVLDQGTTLLR